MDENKRDAQRYRWLRNNKHLDIWWSVDGPEDRNANIDADIDAAMQTEALAKYTNSDNMNGVQDILSEFTPNVTLSLLEFLDSINTDNTNSVPRISLLPYQDCEDNRRLVFVEFHLDKSYYEFLEQRDMLDSIETLYLEVRNGKFERHHVIEHSGNFPIQLVCEE